MQIIKAFVNEKSDLYPAIVYLPITWASRQSFWAIASSNASISLLSIAVLTSSLFFLYCYSSFFDIREIKMWTRKKHSVIKFGGVYVVPPSPIREDPSTIGFKVYPDN